MTEYEIHWLSVNEPPAGRVSFVEAEDFAGAVWEATRLMRAKITNERDAVNAGLYGCGFRVVEGA